MRETREKVEAVKEEVVRAVEDKKATITVLENSFMSTYRVGLVVVHFIDTLVLVSLLLQLMISLVQMDNIQKPQYLAWKRLVLGKMAMDVLYIVASRLTNCMSPIYSEYEISSLRINFTDICKLSDTK